MTGLHTLARIGLGLAATLGMGGVLALHSASASQSAAQSEQTAPGSSKAQTAHVAGKHVEWGYAGPTGPDYWSMLSADYTVCNTGQQESPIDLRNAIPADLGALDISWSPLPIHATNNGHTVQYDAPAGSSFSLAGNRYALAQFHIHHPSEHLLEGQRFPLEIHFVHTMPDGRIGVIGVFVAEGSANPILQKLLDAIPLKEGGTADGPRIEPGDLLPGDHAFDRYEGSLTTPPCTESVDWVVLRTPITATSAQVKQFAAVFPYNARPIQPLDRRFLLQSR